MRALWAGGGAGRVGPFGDESRARRGSRSAFPPRQSLRQGFRLNHHRPAMSHTPDWAKPILDETWTQRAELSDVGSDDSEWEEDEVSRSPPTLSDHRLRGARADSTSRAGELPHARFWASCAASNDQPRHGAPAARPSRTSPPACVVLDPWPVLMVLAVCRRSIH